MGKVKEHLLDILGDNDSETTVYNATFPHPTNENEKYGVLDVLWYLKGLHTLEEIKHVRETKMKDLMEVINDERNEPFMELDSLKLAKFLLNNLCFMIDKELSPKVILSYRDNISEVLISTKLVSGVYVPVETDYLRRIIIAFDFLLHYDDVEDVLTVLMKLDHTELYVYRVDLTRLIDRCLPCEKENRILFEYLLRIPH